MKKAFKFLLFALVLFILYQVAYAGIKSLYNEETRQTSTYQHFNIYFQNVSRWDVEKVAEALENNYQRIVQDLKAPAHPRVRVYMHSDKKEFNKAVGFDAMGVIKGIDTLHLLDYSFPLTLLYPLEETAIHEFAHNVTLNIILQDAMQSGKVKSLDELDRAYNKEGKRFDQVYPRWLWESVAVYEAGQFNSLSFNMWIRKGFPTLQTLNGPHNQIYYVGYTIIDFIIKKWSKDTLLKLIVKNGDVKQVLGLTEQEFEKEWEKFVRERYWVFV